MIRLQDDEKEYNSDNASVLPSSCHPVISSSVLVIRLYQLFLSPVLGVQCRFEPSCSHYAQEALARHGVMKGGFLTFKRLLRCRPLGGHGYDPVPR